MRVGEFVVLGRDLGQDLLRHLQEVTPAPGVFGQDGGAPGYNCKQDSHGCRLAAKTEDTGGMKPMMHWDKAYEPD